jgi:hypothetical protein
MLREKGLDDTGDMGAEGEDADEMIAEISFGKTDMQDIGYLKTMSTDYEEYLRI